MGKELLLWYHPCERIYYLKVVSYLQSFDFFIIWCSFSSSDYLISEKYFYRPDNRVHFHFKRNLSWLIIKVN